MKKMEYFPTWRSRLPVLVTVSFSLMAVFWGTAYFSNYGWWAVGETGINRPLIPADSNFSNQSVDNFKQQAATDLQYTFRDGTATKTTVLDAIGFPIKQLSSTDLQYTFRDGAATKVGQKFNVDKAVLDAIGFPIKDFVTLTPDIARGFVFVTAASQDHFLECMDCIALLQKYQPHRKIIFYDLGISKRDRDLVSSFCNVTVKELKSITGLPQFVYNPKVYSWKPIVIFDALKNYPGVFWVDASVRLKAGGEWKPLLEEITSQSKDAVLFYDNIAFHNVLGATNATMYKYLPVNKDSLRRPGMLGSGSMLFYRTRDTYNNIIHWFTLCALESNCMNPPGSKLGCNFQKNRFNGNCHRYDQSLINILLYNRYNANWQSFVTYKKLLSIARGRIRQQKNKICYYSKS